jgi:hypothetical protein
VLDFSSICYLGFLSSGKSNFVADIYVSRAVNGLKGHLHKNMCQISTSSYALGLKHEPPNCENFLIVPLKSVMR